MDLQKALRIAATICFVVAFLMAVQWIDTRNLTAWTIAGFALLAAGLI